MPLIKVETETLYAAEYVTLSARDGVADITINRPKSLNALNESVIAQLALAFQTATESVQVRGILFRGAGKTFVAGADIRFFTDRIRAGRFPEIERFTREGHELFLAIETSAKPTIALLDGLSLGGGSELALACRAIIATPDGSLGFPETGIGIIPGLGGMFRLARQVGLALAKYYVFTGDRLSARDAFDLGIVTRLVPPEDVGSAVAEILDGPMPDKYRQRAVPERFRERDALFRDGSVGSLMDGNLPSCGNQELARHILAQLGKKSPIALKLAHEIMDRQMPMSISEAAACELDALCRVFGTQDALEGLSAAGTRQPRFIGA